MVTVRRRAVLFALARAVGAVAQGGRTSNHHDPHSSRRVGFDCRPSAHLCPDTLGSVGLRRQPIHANGILLGCLLAQLYVWRKAEGQFHWIATKAWPLVVSLVVLLMLSLVLDVNDLSTYAGGILLGAMAAGVLVAGMVGRDTFGLTASWLSRVFRSRPLWQSANARTRSISGRTSLLGHCPIRSAAPGGGYPRMSLPL